MAKTTTQRGYGARHQAAKAQWQQRLDNGATIQCVCDRDDCTRHDRQCATLISSLTNWDLGHTDDRTSWTGPECVPCNRGAGGRNAARTTNQKRQTIIREW